MKTLLVLTLLVALVGLGVWNSPKAVRDEGYSVVRTMKLTGEVLTIPSVMIDESIVYEPVKAEAIPWAEYAAGRVKNADEIAKQQAEWAGEEYGNVFLPGAEMQEVTTGDGHWLGDGSEGPETDTQSLWRQSLSSKSAPDGDRQTEWVGSQCVAETPSASVDFSDYSPPATDATAEIYEVEDRLSAELEVTK